MYYQFMTIADITSKLTIHKNQLHSMGVASLMVFGSVAKGQSHQDSDIDVIVDFDERAIGLLEFLNLKMFLENILGKKVDLVTRQGLKPQLKDQILKDSIRVA